MAKTGVQVCTLYINCTYTVKNIENKIWYKVVDSILNIWDFKNIFKRLQIVIHKQLSRVEIELATFGLLVKRLHLSPREVRYFL